MYNVHTYLQVFFNWALVQVSNMECMVFYLKGVNFYELRRPPWISQTLFAYWYKGDLKTTKSKTFILTNDLCRKSYQNT